MKKIIFSRSMIEYENSFKANQPFINEYREAFNNVLKSGWFILGENVAEFEKEFAAYNHVKYCAGVASGLDALIISILTLDLPPASEIIVPSNTYIATILAILQTGHKPVLVEPSIATYNIDPELIENSITSKTKAVLVVHLYGKMCDMDPITGICKEHGLYLIEDCAQAHGAEYKGKKAGSFGDIAAFSFYPTKNLGCLGDGGAIVTDNKDLDRKVRLIRNYGSEKKYYNEVIGMNSRLDEIQASFLRIKLRHLDEINSHKRKLAQIYLTTIDNRFIKPVVLTGLLDVYHIFNIRHRSRDDLKNYLLNHGIKTDIHYPVPPHRQNALKSLSIANLPLSDEIHATTLSLPISFFHSTGEIIRVAETINAFGA